MAQAQNGVLWDSEATTPGGSAEWKVESVER